MGGRRRSLHSNFIDFMQDSVVGEDEEEEAISLVNNDYEFNRFKY